MDDYSRGRADGFSGSPGANSSPEYWAGFHSTGAWNPPPVQNTVSDTFHSRPTPAPDFSGPGFGWVGRLIIFLILLAIYASIGLI